MSTPRRAILPAWGAVLLLAVAAVAASAGAHGYFAALTRIDYNARAGTLEVIHRLHHHDVAAFLTVRAGGETAAATERDMTETERLLKPYLTAAFALQADGRPVALTWLGIDVDGEELTAYLEAPLARAPTVLAITNRILVDAFPGQRNTVVVTVPGARASALFSADVERRELRLGES